MYAGAGVRGGIGSGGAEFEFDVYMLHVTRWVMVWSLPCTFSRKVRACATYSMIIMSKDIYRVLLNDVPSTVSGGPSDIQSLEHARHYLKRCRDQAKEEKEKEESGEVRGKFLSVPAFCSVLMLCAMLLLRCCLQPNHFERGTSKTV